MKIIEGTTDFTLSKKTAVAIGKFDGIHLGHQKLLSQLIAQKKRGLLATVFTFDVHAGAFFGGEEKELTTKAEKRAAFEAPSRKRLWKAGWQSGCGRLISAPDRIFLSGRAVREILPCFRAMRTVSAIARN